MAERVVETRIDDNWTVVARCDVFEGTVRITELRVYSRDRKAHAVTSGVLKRVRFTEISNRALGEEGGGSAPKPKRTERFKLDHTQDMRRYLPVAIRYTTLVEERHRNPMRLLADELGLTYIQTRDLLWRIRKHGLITPGRGSVLTRKALALLDE